MLAAVCEPVQEAPEFVEVFVLIDPPAFQARMAFPLLFSESVGCDPMPWFFVVGMTVDVSLKVDVAVSTDPDPIQEKIMSSLSLMVTLRLLDDEEVMLVAIRVCVDHPLLKLETDL